MGGDARSGAGGGGRGLGAGVLRLLRLLQVLGFRVRKRFGLRGWSRRKPAALLG